MANTAGQILTAFLQTFLFNNIQNQVLCNYTFILKKNSIKKNVNLNKTNKNDGQ